LAARLPVRQAKERRRARLKILKNYRQARNVILIILIKIYAIH